MVEVLFRSVGVVSDVVAGSGGTISTALSVGCSLVAVVSVVDTLDDDVVRDVVVVRGVDVVVRTIDGTDSGLWFCELSAVRITAHTRIANNSRAATPEAYTSVCSRLSGSTRSDSTDRRQWGNPQSPGTRCQGW